MSNYDDFLKELEQERKKKAITLSKVKNHIKKCNRKGVRYDWLRFIENKELTPEVEKLFTLWNPKGAPAYDWVKGNDKLQSLINETPAPSRKDEK